MKIGVSICSFAYWVKKYSRKNWVKDQLPLLKMLKGKCDAVELSFDYKSIKNMGNELKAKYKQALKPFNSVTSHLHDLKKGKDSEEQFNKTISKFMKELKIKHFVVHSYDYSHSDFKPNFPIAIENSGHTKKERCSLKELNKFNKPVVLDIEHIEEFRKGAFDKQISSVKSKIVEIHFSVPKSNYLKKYNHHCLVYKSEYPIPKKIPKNTLWIIEGIIPKNRMDLLEKEIELIKSLK